MLCLWTWKRNCWAHFVQSLRQYEDQSLLNGDHPRPTCPVLNSSLDWCGLNETYWLEGGRIKIPSSQDVCMTCHRTPRDTIQYMRICIVYFLCLQYLMIIILNLYKILIGIKNSYIESCHSKVKESIVLVGWIQL